MPETPAGLEDKASLWVKAEESAGSYRERRQGERSRAQHQREAAGTNCNRAGDCRLAQVCRLSRK